LNSSPVNSKSRSNSKESRHKRRPPRRRARPKPVPAGPKRPEPRFEAILAQIGVPEDEPFTPDPFQTEAISRLEARDVLVSAPTGSGKTWIALQAIKRCLESGGHAWYACPLKALSNAKFEEFGRAFGPDLVGIVTGDRKENAQAPLIVGTTEILRNQLYDCMWHKTPLPYELVVLDEAHYLGEPERGVVWEETLIYVPPTTRLLLLSATIRNTKELAAWLASIRRVACSVVLSDERPVPLYPLFLYPDGQIGMLSARKGLTRDVERCVEALSKRRGRPPPWQYDKVIGHLRKYNLLPAIFFLKSRAECDRAITTSAPERRSPEEQAAFRRDLDACLERFPFLKQHRALPYMVDGHVASHHAGHLPNWKVLVEEMMLRGHLDAIFATSTVAGGVNFPARTVVLVQSDRYDGKEFQDLSATDLQQMIGRAGRRGKDRVGFALVIPGPFLDPKLIHRRLRSPPDVIESQIRINFSMVLNLLQSHSPEDIRVLIDRSLAAFQQARRLQARRKKAAGAKAEKVDVREVLWQDFLRHKDFLQETGFVDDQDELTWEGRWAAQLRLDHPLLVAEAIRKGSFEGAAPEIVAAMIAPFVVDGGDRSEELDRALTVRSKDLTRRIDRMRKDLKEPSRLMKRRGFEVSDVPMWPAVAAFLWAKGVSWNALLRAVPLEEGAMSMLIMRTADHLNQIIGLRESHPELAETAREAVPLIFREPVWI